MEKIQGEKREAVKKTAAQKASKAVNAHNAVADVVNEVVEKEVETVNRLYRLIGSRNVQAVIHHRRFSLGLGIAAAAGAAAVGYILGKRNGEVWVVETAEGEQLEFDFNNLVNDVALATDMASGIDLNVWARPGTSTVDDAADEKSDSEETDGGNPKVDAAEGFIAQRLRRTGRTLEIEGTTEGPELILDDKPVEKANIFAQMADEEWDYDKEIRKRSQNAPYVIHKDEFFADEKNYTQTTLTYYAGDNILADENEKPVYNHESVVGPMRFGHGSGDPNVFYVRNDRMRAEHEILLDEGLYSVVVMGLEIEDNRRVEDLKHSRSTRFRQE